MTTPDRPVPPLALTMGDPAGIGPIVTAMAWRERKTRKIPPFLVFGDPKVFENLQTKIPVKTIAEFDQTTAAFGQALPVFEIKVSGKVRPGLPDKAQAKGVYNAIQAAATAALEGKVAGVVTNPVYKKTLLEAGFKHAGHTTLLGEICKAKPVMMLANEDLRTVPVTVHIPLKDVPRALTKKLIVETAKIVSQDLETRFRLGNPRLGLTGLNPHAGEEGKLGMEEQEIIIPAIGEIRKSGIHAEGPFPADTAFTPAMRMKFDAFLAMTHDQALIPVKTLDFRKTVNITLGLPIIRTSPAHGTGFDLIRGGRTPDPESLIRAILMAQRLSA